MKAHCEDLWQDFSKHADRHFLTQLPVSFHQRWFEMYLTVSLIRAGATVECPKPGPDVLLKLDRRRIWIEAVCVTEGQPRKPDSVPKSVTGQAQETPVRQYVARIRNALDEKAKKFRKYLDDGIVDQGDITVISINVGQIPFLFLDLEDCTMKSLYGVGDRIVTVNKVSGRPIDSGRASIHEIRKTSGASINVLPFVDGSMAHVSSVLISWANVSKLPSPLGADFVLYPNLSCMNPWQSNSLPLAEEWSFTQSACGWSGRKSERYR